jgi:malonate decarboxylase gamma subunit
MEIRSLLDALFPSGHGVTFDGVFFAGGGQCRGSDVAILGTIDTAPIGVELAYRLAGEVLRVIEHHPGRPILLLVDTQGQRLSRRDELLGINGYMAHLAKCIDLARRRGHPVIGLVYSQAVSGGFLASSMLADRCFALPEAEIRVMKLPAMARITKIPLDRLETLSATSPVFAPGVDNFLRMGAIESLWSGDLSECLAEALAGNSAIDRRRAAGLARQGRLLAGPVAERVRTDAGI